MFSNNRKITWFLIIAATCLGGPGSTIASAQQTKKPFSVADEIGLARFDDPTGWQADAVVFSPDGNYLAVHAEHGRLDLNCIEGTLRFYSIQDVKNFLQDKGEPEPPSPAWEVKRCPAKEGVVIRNWRWLADSSGVAFLEHTDSGNQRIVLADLKTKAVEPLTPATEVVTGFDISDRLHYVYTIVDPTGGEQLQAERQAPAIVGTGRRLFELILPDNPRSHNSERNHVWAVVAGKRFEVTDDHKPVSFIENFALSPDGHFLAGRVPIIDVPSSWEMLYPSPSYGSYGRRIRDGHHDPESGDKSVQEYVLIDLQTHSVQSLTGAPTSHDAGWFVTGDKLSWSRDSKAISLPGTFLKSKDNTPSRPCIAVIVLSQNTESCVEVLKALTGPGLNSVEVGYHNVTNVRFVDGDKRRLLVTFRTRGNESYGNGATEYRLSTNGTWGIAEQFQGPPQVKYNGLEATVKQSFKQPQLLVVGRNGKSRVLWDPNPQIKDFEFGEVSVYIWKDREGRDRKGGLYKPADYRPGQRYPLVIQTHGFVEALFEPSGLLPTAYAARELASAGMMVLQVDLDMGHCPMLTPSEGACAVSAYEAAAKQLVSEGLVDPEEVGIIGFSRTCFYVMEMLTTSSIHLKAASITDGVLEDYLQYMLSDTLVNETNPMIGAAPFGEGLQLWLKRSPSFNLDKITTPLLVVGNGPNSLLSMWEPYAGLRYLGKPVELMMLNTNEHIVSNPSVRLASQGGSVDWFRFWLQDYEDPNPAKTHQYARWRELRKMQEANEHNSTSSQATSH